VSQPLPRSFYARDTVTVARDLLGRILARRLRGGAVLRGRIVETEAYVGERDQACHARAGRTPRTRVMYGPPGVAYVYFTYGMHHLLNAVTEPEGAPAAVLIRAAEPLDWIDRMARARGLGARGRDASHTLASGPAKLCQAFALDLRQNGADLLGPHLWIEPGEPVRDRDVATSPRIGCETVPAPWDRIPWRFFVAGSRFVTPGRPAARGEKLGVANRPPYRE
jgi:DNA-3-methyladenine glycosylase